MPFENRKLKMGRTKKENKKNEKKRQTKFNLKKKPAIKWKWKKRKEWGMKKSATVQIANRLGKYFDRWTEKFSSAGECTNWKQYVLTDRRLNLRPCGHAIESIDGCKFKCKGLVSLPMSMTRPSPLIVIKIALNAFLPSALSHFKSVMRLKADRQGKLHPSLQSGEASSIGQSGHDIGAAHPFNERLCINAASAFHCGRNFSGSATLPQQLISTFCNYSFSFILLHWLGCRLLFDFIS